MLLLSSADFFQNQLFQKESFRNSIRVPNDLDPDQDRLCVGPDLVPNCLRRFNQQTTKDAAGEESVKHHEILPLACLPLQSQFQR